MADTQLTSDLSMALSAVVGEGHEVRDHSTAKFRGLLACRGLVFRVSSVHRGTERAIVLADRPGSPTFRVNLVGLVRSGQRHIFQLHPVQCWDDVTTAHSTHPDQTFEVSKVMKAIRLGDPRERAVHSIVGDPATVVPYFPTKSPNLYWTSQQGPSGDGLSSHQSPSPHLPVNGWVFQVKESALQAPGTVVIEDDFGNGVFEIHLVGLATDGLTTHPIETRADIERIIADHPDELFVSLAIADHLHHMPDLPLASSLSSQL